MITAIFYPLFPVSTWHQGLLLADTNSFATKFESGTAAGVKTVCAVDESRPISFASSKTNVHDAFLHLPTQMTSVLYFFMVFYSIFRVGINAYFLKLMTKPRCYIKITVFLSIRTS